MVRPAPDVVGKPIAAGYATMEPGRVDHRPYGLPEWALWLSCAGTCRIFGPRAEQLLLPQGHLALFAPDAEQRYTPHGDQPWRPLWVVFTPRAHWQEWLRWPEAWPGVASLAPVEEATEILERIVACCRSTRARGRELAMADLERVLLLCDERNPLRGTQRDPRIDVVLHAMEDLDRPLRLDELAERAGLSPAQLNRLFRRQVGRSPMAFYEERRLQRAAELLRCTGATVATVAAQVGYDDPFYFSARFKRMYGLGPRAYRRR